MLMPDVFGNDLFGEIFDYPHNGRKSTVGLMKTDVLENDNSFLVKIDLPGVKKEDLSAELKDGYLTVTANVNENNDKKDNNGRYIRCERYSGSFTRSFYVGEAVTEKDINAKLDNGVLELNVPKKTKLPEAEQRRMITIG